jgi:hypothetical protein
MICAVSALHGASERLADIGKTNGSKGEKKKGNREKKRNNDMVRQQHSEEKLSSY